MLVDRLRLVELALAFEIECQAVKVAHHGVTKRNPAKTIKRSVELSLALQRQAHHPVRLGRLLVRLELAGLGDQETLGCQGQVADGQQHRRQHELDPGCTAREQTELGAQQHDKQHQRHDGRSSG